VNNLRLILRLLWRDLRAGELTVLAVALVLAIAALTSVGFLADRVERAVQREAHQLLGGDLLLTADHPWAEQFRQAARDRGLHLAESASFASMVATPESVHLAEVKAISPGYPLRGALRVAPGLNRGDAETREVPALGTVWPDARLAAALRVDQGGLLRLGRSMPRVAAIVTLEPDRGVNPFSLAPRLIVNLADVHATGLIQPGSRVQWRLHVAGEPEAVAAFRSWAEAHLGRGESLEGLDNARPEIRTIVERAQRFLRLAALLTVVLAAVAVGMAARRYMQTHLDACAVMRCLGSSERQILLIHGGEFALLGLATIFCGSLLGYLIQTILHGVLSGLIADNLPPPGPLPWFHGAAVGSVLVIGFVLPPLLRLKAVPTLRVLRREWGGSEPLTKSSYVAGILCLAMMMLWMAQDIILGSIVLVGFAIAVGGYTGLGYLLLAWGGRFSSVGHASGWRLGMANLRRRRDTVLLQVVALALGLTTLLILTLARGDFLAAWQAKMPPDAPNRFLINVQPDQRMAISDFFVRAGLEPVRFEPMIKGRLTAVNGRRIGPGDFSDERARRLVEREFNLSTRDDLPTGNTVMAGRWFAAAAEPQFSVEKGLAESLNLHIGDELSFEISGRSFAARISSLRKLDWDSMRVNFFVIAPADSMADHPASYITSFHLPAGHEMLTTDLVRAFPNITMIDVAALVQQLQATLTQVVGAIQWVFGFALLAGLVVLYAALQASAAERHYELAILRALGGRRGQMRMALLVEFAGIGVVAGLLAALGASAIAVVLARLAFQLTYLPSPLLMLAGTVVGMMGVAIAGVVTTWRALDGSVLGGLRRV
jgi:putative ABC transport system permease protein